MLKLDDALVSVVAWYCPTVCVMNGILAYVKQRASWLHVAHQYRYMELLHRFIFQANICSQHLHTNVCSQHLHTNVCSQHLHLMFRKTAAEVRSVMHPVLFWDRGIEHNNAAAVQRVAAESSLQAVCQIMIYLVLRRVQKSTWADVTRDPPANHHLANSFPLRRPSPEAPPKGPSQHFNHSE
jgi:hypothetical protein